MFNVQEADTYIMNDTEEYEKKTQLPAWIEKKPGGRFSSAVLKYAAAVTMFIDHAAVALLQTSYTADGTAVYRSGPRIYTMYQWMRHIGRFAFPIFCFFIVEGYFHTRSRVRYALQLLLFGIASQIPFEYACFTEKSRLAGYHGNVMFTLLLGLLCVWALDTLVMQHIAPRYSRSGNCGEGRLAKDELQARNGYTRAETYIKDRTGTGAAGTAEMALRIAGAVLIIAGACVLADHFHTDYRYGGIITILIFYLLRKYPVPACCSAYLALSLYSHSEVWAVPGFLGILLYNGKRGAQSKYFFYAFYPVHLLLLWILKML